MQRRAVFQTGIFYCRPPRMLVAIVSEVRKRRGRPIRRGAGHNQETNQTVVEHDK